MRANGRNEGPGKGSGGEVFVLEVGGCSPSVRASHNVDGNVGRGTNLSLSWKGQKLIARSCGFARAPRAGKRISEEFDHFKMFCSDSSELSEMFRTVSRFVIEAVYLSDFIAEYVSEISLVLLLKQSLLLTAFGSVILLFSRV